MEIIVKNYRLFTADHPLKLQVNDGITAIVGPNDSGKSFVLKFFYELRNLFSVLSNMSNLPSFSLGRNNFEVNLLGIRDRAEVFSRFNEDDMEINFNLAGVNFLLKIERSRNFCRFEQFCFNGQCINANKKLKNLGLEISNNKIFKKDTKEEILNFVDIANLFKRLQRVIYFPAFRNAVNIGAQEDFYDISIGEAFIKAWQNFETHKNLLIREKAIQVKEDLREIFEHKNFNIISAPDQKEIIVNINDRSYRLSELGSGITQFILVFINAAIKKPSFVLIDEPESNLHPKLQIDFVNRLLKYTENGIIFATHNLGLAHSVADRVYSVYRKDSDSPSIIKPFDKTPKFTEFLGELNFSNFPILGFKKVLLVEGPSDLKVFRIFLRKKNKYKDFLILPLGGSSMIKADTAKELQELKRLGKDVEIYCWIDSEKKSESSEIHSERKKFKKECEELGFDVTISERRSIENYFPLESIQKVNPRIKKLDPYEELPPEWHKGSNWRVAQEVELGDLDNTDLYNFLDRI